MKPWPACIACSGVINYTAFRPQRLSCVFFFRFLKRTVNIFNIILALCTSYLTQMVKQSLHRPWRFHEVEAPIFQESAQDGGELVSPSYRPPLTPRKHPATHFCYRLSRPKWLCQWKIPMTPSGIEPATFLFVAQCLYQPRHAHTHALSLSLSLQPGQCSQYRDEPTD